MKKLLVATAVAACITATPALAEDPAQPSQTTETFGKWTVRCVSNAKAQDGKLCEVVHVVSGQGGVIAQLAIGRVPGGNKTMFVVRAPLGVLLSKPVEILGMSDDSAPAELSYVTCLASGCLAQRDATAAELSFLADAESFKLVFYERTGRRIEITMPTGGLKTALARLGLHASQ